jgi:hypothetical protein
MALTYSKLNRIKFPIYEMPSDNWSKADGLLFLDDKIVDDKNQSGDTLGLRRLQTPHRNLFELKKQYDNFSGLIKNADKCFIDTNGTPFTYEKTQWCTLKYHRIKNVSRKNDFSLLYLDGVKFPFVVPRPPADEIRYAGILYYGLHPWTLYEYSETSLKDTRRKV